MKETLDEATEPWGVMVERVEVKDVRVPEQLQRAMAAEAEAAREARAKVIAAEGEHKASRALRLAAEVIVDSPAALQVAIDRRDQTPAPSLVLLRNDIHTISSQLRYLQTLNGISAENNSTIIFPVPIDMMSSILDTQPSHQHFSQTTSLEHPPHSPPRESLEESSKVHSDIFFLSFNLQQ